MAAAVTALVPPPHNADITLLAGHASSLARRQQAEAQQKIGAAIAAASALAAVR